MGIEITMHISNRNRFVMLDKNNLKSHISILISNHEEAVKSYFTNLY
ncbi:hypothetical protein HDF23_005415 [Mucilaginibacter lappiensis]|uniref:Uncharacterized protein n=1 Tax=Mucilaginibacter lappiensis TaxID=354630 RepID=A0ABR6PS76_9SPHI|nr:hypothetical protein [Mucilaginibacter lappiensis]